MYNNNGQLGGTQIMYNNGVSHTTVANDLEGVAAIVRWLSYIPKVSLYVCPLLLVISVV